MNILNISNPVDLVLLDLFLTECEFKDLNLEFEYWSKPEEKKTQRNMYIDVTLFNT